MPKIEFEFPEPNDDSIEVEPSNMKALEEKPEGVKPPKKEEKPEPESKDEPEIEVVDDTPKADRGRTPSEPPEDVTDDELEEYSEKVQKRIKHFSKGYHDERRAKEAALREAEEARRFAQAQMEEIKRLRANVGQSQSAMLQQAEVTIKRDLAEAQASYKAAYDAGDADKLLEAQEKLTTARLREQQLQQIKQRAPLQPKEPDVQQEAQAPAPQAQQPRPQPDKRAQEWAARNTWFGQPGKDQMTALALGYHSELVNNGVDPTSDEYYERLDARMRNVFPDEFEGTTPDEPAEEKPSRSQVVAPATRSKAPKKVRLTQTQVNLAKRMGIPLEEYAKHAALLEMNKDG